MKKFLAAFLLLPSLLCNAQPSSGPFPIGGGGSGTNLYTAGNGLALSGNQFSILSTVDPAKSLFVSKAGNDATGVRGTLQAYLTITAAKASSQAGDTIYVYPGTYVENNLLKAGVNYFFYQGATVSYNETSLIDTVGGFGIFDDRTSGATTNIIGGLGNFYYTSGTNRTVSGPSSYLGPTNCLGLLVVTNANSDIRFSCNDLSFGSIDASGAGATIEAGVVVINCRYVSVECNQLLDPFINGVTISGNLQQSFANGAYWAYGELHLKSKHIGNFGNYSTWGDENYLAGVAQQVAQPQIANAAFNMWVNGDLCEGGHYTTMVSTNQRAWYNFNEVNNLNNSFAAFEFDGNGKFYVTAQKIAANSAADISSTPPSSAANLQVWVTAEKLSSTASWVQASGMFYVNVQHYEDLGGVVNGISVGNPGSSYFNGGVMAMKKASQTSTPVSMNAAGATMTLTDMFIDTSAGTNSCISVGSAGLTLNNCSLTTSNTVTCISAVSARTVTNNGFLNWNVAPSVNITLALPATLYGTNLILGVGTNTPSFTLVQTNWIDGGTYTNQTGRPILVITPCNLTMTGVAGNSSYALRVPGSTTNSLAMSTLITSLATTMTNQVSAFVTNGGTFIFTNTSTGAGDAGAILKGGQYMVY